MALARAKDDTNKKNRTPMGNNHKNVRHVTSDQVFIQAEEQRTRSSLIFGYKTFPKVSRTRLDNGRKM